MSSEDADKFGQNANTLSDLFKLSPLPHWIWTTIFFDFNFSFDVAYEESAEMDLEKTYI